MCIFGKEGSDMECALINKVWGRAPFMQTHDSSIHHFVKPEGSAIASESRKLVRPSRGMGTLPVWDNWVAWVLCNHVWFYSTFP